MNAGIGQEGGPSVIDRARSIILRPGDEWPKIEGEATSQGEILRGYVLPLAAIGPVAAFIGGQVFGYRFLVVSWRPPLLSALTQAIVSYLLMIAGVFALTYIADFLAPKFAGQSSRLKAFQLVAYGATAAWLAGIFYLVPWLWLFTLLGFYSIYLIYTGATPMMKVPEDKAAGYTAVTILCGVAIMIVVQAIAGRFISQPGAGILRDSGEVSGTITLPGGGKIDLGEAEKMQRRVEDAVSGKTRPIDIDGFKQLMPESIGRFQRVSIETTSLGAVGSSGEAAYRSGDHQFTLTVTDMSAAGAIAGMAGAFGVAQSREDADSYERTGSVGGQMQTEAWNRMTKRGKFGKVVASRFMIMADGSAESIDQLKQAVDAIDADDLEDLVD
jgi:hypothetical protein